MKKTSTKSPKLHKALKKTINFIADSLELIVKDLTGTKRRRARVVYRSAQRQAKPVVIVKVVKEGK